MNEWWTNEELAHLELEVAELAAHLVILLDDANKSAWIGGEERGMPEAQRTVLSLLLQRVGRAVSQTTIANKGIKSSVSDVRNNMKRNLSDAAAKTLGDALEVREDTIVLQLSRHEVAWIDVDEVLHAHPDFLARQLRAAGGFRFEHQVVRRADSDKRCTVFVVPVVIPEKWRGARVRMDSTRLTLPAGNVVRVRAHRREDELGGQQIQRKSPAGGIFSQGAEDDDAEPGVWAVDERLVLVVSHVPTELVTEAVEAARDWFDASLED